MSSPIKEQIANDLNQVKEVGQLRVERVREIVRSAVAQVTSEFKQGSGEIRSLVKDVISGAITGLKSGSSEIQEDVTASIEGAIEGVNSTRDRSISEVQAEIKQLLAKLESEEEKLQQQVESSITGIEEAGREAPSDIRAYVESAINRLQDSGEAALLKKRYARLQAQAAILRANLAARYGGRHQEIKGYLDEAKSWYDKTRAKAEDVGAAPLEQKRSQLEERFGEAGTALAKKERQLRRTLSELLQSAAVALREKEPTHGTDPGADRPHNDLSDL